MEQHPIIGRTLSGAGRIYTRTIVLWTVGIDINTEELWNNVDVTLGNPGSSTAYNILHTMQLPVLNNQPAPKRIKLEVNDDTSQQYPIVRMMSTSTHRKGDLLKRMRNNPFRSVLSMDVEYKGCMPNLKISNRNTIQATGLAQFNQGGIWVIELRQVPVVRTCRCYLIFCTSWCTPTATVDSTVAPPFTLPSTGLQDLWVTLCWPMCISNLDGAWTGRDCGTF